MAEGSVATETESKSLSFLNEAKGKSTRVNIVDKRSIAGGDFGTTYQADVMIGNHRKRFVIKEFNRTTEDANGNESTPQENAKKAIANYRLAKEAGLKVFPTYRIDQDGDGTTILMTSGNTESTICIGEASTLEDFGEPLIQALDPDKYEAMVRDLYNQAIIATAHGITLHGDAFFFLYDKKTGNLDFVIGDLDNVNKREPPRREPHLLYNLHSARGALTVFLTHNIEGAPFSANYDNYMNTSFETYNAIKIAQGYGNN